MTRLFAVLLLAVLLVVLYTLMYAGWSRRARRHPSAAVASNATAVTSVAPVDPVTSTTSTTPATRLGGAGVVRAQGTYISTTSTASRLDRVAAAGLGVRARATMTVDAEGVTWEREGAPTVHVDTARLLGVSVERGMAGKFVGQRRLVVVAWRSASEDFATGFLPRYAADRALLLAHLERLVPVGTVDPSRVGEQAGGAA